MFRFKWIKESGRESRSSGNGKRTFTLELSLSALITSAVVSCVALGWVFAFGVIIGRGYSPAAQLPGLASIMPQSSQNATQTSADILKAEDLTFMTDLKQKPGAPMQPTRSQNSTEAAASVPGGNGTISAARAGGSPVAGNATRPASSLTQPEGVFDFTIQIVAYKNSSQADTLRERLEGEGMRTRMTVEKAPNGKARWYRVQVILRGTDADAEAAKVRIAALGMKDASITSRKAAGRSR